MTIKTQSIGAEVTEILRDEILSGKLKPRERLVEEDLAKRLNVSRTPVREAIRNLESIGLVQHMMYKGAFVSDVNAPLIRDIYAVRIILEGQATRLAVPNVTPKAVQQMEIILRRIEDAGEIGDHVAFEVGNEEFHLLLYSFCGNALLEEMVRDLLIRCAVFRNALPRSRQNIAQVVQAHRVLLNAVIDKDMDAAQRIAEDHIRVFRSRLISKEW